LLLSTQLTISYKDNPPVLQGLRLQVKQSEILGLVGHSGCGKSSLALAILGLLAMKGGTAHGSILWNGMELLRLKEREWRQLRGKEITYVPQSAMSSLNPALRIGTQLAEAWKLHAKGSRRSNDCMNAMLLSLNNVSLPATEDFLRRYPSEISVGQAQRVLIAMAILHRPALLIADEPTSALDAITQSEIRALFLELNSNLGMGILFISHDLLFAASLCHRIAILNAGEIVECGTPGEVFYRPTHPFTRRLVSALPSLAGSHPAFPEAARESEPLSGETSRQTLLSSNVSKYKN
jgi:ABC-type dipeptide/oligopeptide/nickel transport system ATPase component